MTRRARPGPARAPLGSAAALAVASLAGTVVLASPASAAPPTLTYKTRARTYVFTDCGTHVFNDETSTTVAPGETKSFTRSASCGASTVQVTFYVRGSDQVLSSGAPATANARISTQRIEDGVECGNPRLSASEITPAPQPPYATYWAKPTTPRTVGMGCFFSGRPSRTFSWQGGTTF
jgi:hypothetical protein